MSITGKRVALPQFWRGLSTTLRDFDFERQLLFENQRGCLTASQWTVSIVLAVAL